MKRPSSSSHSVHALPPISSSEEEDIGAGISGSGASSGQPGEKKRRLSAAQVKALEKDFEADTKLDPERKARPAQELGLQPRQVTVWFQKRRARWRTKRLERDFAALASRHHALKLDPRRPPRRDQRAQSEAFD